MENWVGVVKRAKESLQSVLSEDHASSTGHSVQRLLDSIIRMSNENKAHKWLSNFEVAAIHLSVHMKVCFFYLYDWTQPISIY
jgi:hypothetical protein